MARVRRLNEIVLPVSLVDGFGYAPAAWGFLVWINPLLVTLFQLRLTRATAFVSPAPKLVTALLVMGLPYLLLVYSHAVWAVIAVVVIFVIGEMLWVPTSQAVVASLAPRDIRGAYMGAFGSAPAIGFALSPLIGLQGRNSFGDDATWTMFACLGVVAAVLGGLALATVRRRTEPQTILETRAVRRVTTRMNGRPRGPGHRNARPRRAPHRGGFPSRASGRRDA